MKKKGTNLSINKQNKLKKASIREKKEVEDAALEKSPEAAQSNSFSSSQPLYQCNSQSRNMSIRRAINHYLTARIYRYCCYSHHFASSLQIYLKFFCTIMIPKLYSKKNLPRLKEELQGSDLDQLATFQYLRINTRFRRASESELQTQMRRLATSGLGKYASMSPPSSGGSISPWMIT
ncbi:hypothetical protein LguiA_007598 [Lonicera macranthoides]